MKVVAVDNSILKVCWGECSTKAVLERLGYDTKRPNGALQVGTLFHHGVANFLGGMEAESVLTTFQDEYEGIRALGGYVFSDEHLTDPIIGKPQYALENIKKVMKEWIARHPMPEPFPGLVIPRNLVEVSFALPLDEIKVGKETYLVIIEGQLDAAGEEGDRLWTVETKTVGAIQPWWKLKFESDSQNTEYQWAAEVTTGKEVLGTYLNAIETRMVPNSERTCYKHTYADIPEVEPSNPRSKDHPTYSECGYLHIGLEVFTVNRTEGLIEQWKKDAIAATKKFIELDKFVRQGIIGATKTRTQGKFNESCIFCNFREWCIRRARDVDYAEMAMSHRHETRDVTVGIFDSIEEYEATKAKQQEGK